MQDERLAELTRDQKSSAPVRVPHEEALAVNLVPMNLVEELDGLRAAYATDLSLVMMLGGVVGGNLLSFLTLAELPQFDATHLVLLVGLALVFTHSLYKLRREHKRASDLKSKLLRDFKSD